MSWNYKTPGIPDELFFRTENVPITKEEIRSIVVSKLRLKENGSVIDIGCGSGSITVELCIQCSKGKIYAIDLDSDAIDLTRKNLQKFNVNAEIIYGNALEVLDRLPNVDNIVVGGTTGHTENIITKSIDKLNKDGRLVVTSILIETMYKVMMKLRESDRIVDLDFTQVSILKGRNTKTGTMRLARNPVLIISATRL